MANQQMSGGTKILIGCLAVVGLLFVGGIIAVIVAFSTFASWGPPLLASGAKQMIKQSNLPQAEKQGVIKQIDQLMQEFDSGKISGDDLQKILEQVGNSPIPAITQVYIIESEVVQPSGLSDDKKQQAKVTLNRLAHALNDQKIDMQAFQGILGPVSNQTGGGQIELKQNPTDAEVQEMLSNARDAVAQTDVPEDVEPFSISRQLASAINEALGRDPNAPDAFTAPEAEPLLTPEATTQPATQTAPATQPAATHPAETDTAATAPGDG